MSIKDPLLPDPPIPHLHASSSRSSSSPSPHPRPPLDSRETTQRTLTSESSISSLRSQFSGVTLKDTFPGLRNGEINRTDTPSETSVSDDEEVRAIMDEGLRRWASQKSGQRGKGKGKGKGRAVESDGEEQEGEVIDEGLAGNLPPEILIHILRWLSEPHDLYSALQVSRSWCLAGFPLLWCRPYITSCSQLTKLTRVLQTPHPNLPYHSQIRRLNLGAIASYLTDDLLEGLETCDRVDRLTISGATRINSLALISLINGMKELSTVDFANTGAVVDNVMCEIAESCERIQGINVGGCKSVGDQGLIDLAEKRKGLRRVKIGQCHRVTDKGLVALVRNCLALADLDMNAVPQLTNASLYSLFLNSTQIRELRMSCNDNINDEGIPNLKDLQKEINDTKLSRVSESLDSYPWYAIEDGRRLSPRSEHFMALRIVDFTSCTAMNDQGVQNLIANAPKVRHLILNKCTSLTDVALEAIARLGKQLHHLHLGHCTEITDAGLGLIAKACTRIRYLDLTCCAKLTDKSLCQVATYSEKLSRLGLVKVSQITDETIYRFADRHPTLERFHLSYCEKLSIKAITKLLNSMKNLTHLSLTAVTAFKMPELQQFCRPVPAEYTPLQRESFCVYSDRGIAALRVYLNARAAAFDPISYSDNDSRRGSNDSYSSMTTGQYSPPHHAPSSNSPMNPVQAMYATHQWMLTAQPFSRNEHGSGEAHRSAGAFTTAPSAHRRDRGGSTPNTPMSTVAMANASSARHQRRARETADNDSSRDEETVPVPVFRYASSSAQASQGHHRDHRYDAETSEANLPGVPLNVWTASAPNFFMPGSSSSSNSNSRRSGRNSSRSGGTRMASSRSNRPQATDEVTNGLAEQSQQQQQMRWVGNSGQVWERDRNGVIAAGDSRRQREVMEDGRQEEGQRSEGPRGEVGRDRNDRGKVSSSYTWMNVFGMGRG